MRMVEETDRRNCNVLPKHRLLLPAPHRASDCVDHWSVPGGRLVCLKSKNHINPKTYIRTHLQGQREEKRQQDFSICTKLAPYLAVRKDWLAESCCNSEVERNTAYLTCIPQTTIIKGFMRQRKNSIPEIKHVYFNKLKHYHTELLLTYRININKVNMKIHILIHCQILFHVSGRLI